MMIESILKIMDRERKMSTTTVTIIWWRENQNNNKKPISIWLMMVIIRIKDSIPKTPLHCRIVRIQYKSWAIITVKFVV